MTFPSLPFTPASTLAVVLLTGSVPALAQSSATKPAAVAPAPEIDGRWRFPDGMETEIGRDGTIKRGSTVLAFWQKAPPNGKVAQFLVKWAQSGKTEILTFVPGTTPKLTARDAKGMTLTATYLGPVVAAVQPLPAPAPPPRPEPAKPAPALPEPAKPQPTGPHIFAGMELSEKWLPDRPDTRKNYLSSLAFYAKWVVGHEPRGQEKAPDTIWGPIKWLMPLDEAVKIIPRSGLAGTVKPFVNDSFPRDSLSFQGLSGKFIDGNLTFNWIYLICDRKKQVVSVQFQEQTPNRYRYIKPVPDVSLGLPQEGFLDPYYDFINVKASARGGVFFAVYPNTPREHVTMIKTCLGDPRPIWAVPKEDDHWYLTAPLAGRILDIADRMGISPATP